MNDTFEKRIRALAISGWWALLAAVGMIVFLWLVYLGTINTQPTWILPLLGKSVTWKFFEKLCLSAITVAKILFWFFAWIVIWITLWSRRLHR